MSKTYHVTWRSIGLAFILILLFVPFECICAVMFLNLLATFYGNQLSSESLFMFVALGTLGIIMFTLFAVIFVYRIGTFLRLSPDGLEYHRWPFKTITCKWNEVEKISQGNIMGFTFSTLMLPKSEIGLEIPIGKGVLGSAKYKLVPLNDFRGWPNGELRDELRLYAPKFFA